MLHYIQHDKGERKVSLNKPDWRGKPRLSKAREGLKQKAGLWKLNGWNFAFLNQFQCRFLVFCKLGAKFIERIELLVGADKV